MQIPQHVKVFLKLSFANEPESGGAATRSKRIASYADAAKIPFTARNSKNMRISITIPVYNEEDCLAPALNRLHQFLSLSERQPFAWQILVVNNGSTDGTLESPINSPASTTVYASSTSTKKAADAVSNIPGSASEAEILSYMDVDLSSDLASLPALVAPLLSGEYDLAVGSRLLMPELTKRSSGKSFRSFTI